MRVVGTSGLTGSNRQDFPGIIPNPAAIIPSPVGVRHVSDQSASSTVLLQQQQTTEKLLTTPGSPMESIRRRYPTGAPSTHTVSYFSVNFTENFVKLISRKIKKI